jgi:flagellin FlaB
MFDTDKPEERGQVGIGTLIVFIALVLVAAIAAGVLINTADLLQGQAQQTGEESTDQVTNNLNVLSVTGISADTGGTDPGAVNQIDIRVQRSPGAGDIDLGQAELQVIGPAGTGTYSGMSGLLTDDGDRVTVSIDIDSDGDIASAFNSASSGASALLPGDEAQITITTASGGQSNIQVTLDKPFEDSTQAVDL